MIVETSYPWRDDRTPAGALPNPWAWPRTAVVASGVILPAADLFRTTNSGR